MNAPSSRPAHCFIKVGAAAPSQTVASVPRVTPSRGNAEMHCRNSHQDTTSGLVRRPAQIGRWWRSLAGSIGNIRIGNGPACRWAGGCIAMRRHSLSPAASGGRAQHNVGLVSPAWIVTASTAAILTRACAPPARAAGRLLSHPGDRAQRPSHPRPRTHQRRRMNAGLEAQTDPPPRQSPPFAFSRASMSR